ncbi:MAG: hypothetical protein KDB46_12315 [Solirubrobacterales bacterium]|nr:hypothetical protein [Solirubrobacterales bacterium]
MRVRAGLVVVAGLASTLVAASAAAASTHPLEPIAIKHLPVADGYSAMSEPDWLPDGRRMVVVLRPAADGGDQIGVMRRNGSGLRCLTCGLDPTTITGPPPDDRPIGFGKPFAFSDGKRLLMRLGIQPGQPGAVTQNFVYAILECAPSVADCEQRDLVPLNLPGGGIAQGVQNREARLSPDGRWVAWTELSAAGPRMSVGRLQRNAGDYTLAGVRILNPDAPLNGDSENWRAVSPSFEFKNFSVDGRHAFYSSMYDAENFDTFEVDLRTGERERVTRQTEWDEDISDSPSGGTLSQYTSRGFGRMVALAQVPRPPFVDAMLFTWTGRFMLNQVNRKCLLEPWVMPATGPRRGFFGQPVNPDLDPGWDSRTLGSWSPDGTRLLFWEARSDATGEEDPVGRITIARFPARSPAEHTAAPTPAPKWAPRRDDYAGYHSNTGTFVVQGADSGTATVTIAGSFFAGTESVTYEDYSDDGRTFLDGTESVDEPSILGSLQWNADLRVSGAHRGVLKSDLEFVTGGLATGTILSRLDGRERTSLPPPRCRPLRVPRLRVSRAGRHGERMRIRVRSRITGDRRLRPVIGAAVTAGGHSATTNDHGVAKLPVAGGAIRAEAAGFRPAG